jgi:predicted TIM-barrel fold metal-dependent hydrolase
MRTITLEEHFLTAEAIKATDHLRDRGLALSYHEPTLTARLLDIGAGRVADMDSSGIDLQILSLAVCGVEELEAAQATAIAHDTNEQIAASMRAYPKRFGGFATLALDAPEAAAKEFEYCISKLRFSGALINGTTKGMFLDHPRFTPILEVAQSLDVPIYIHPAPIPKAVRDTYYGGLPNQRGEVLSVGGWGWHSEVAIESLRLMAAGIFDQFPKLKIIIGHMGENLPYALARIDSILSRSVPAVCFTRNLNGHSADPAKLLRLERPVTEYFHDHFYVTTSGFFTLPPLLLASQVVGPDHLMFSIDYPFSPNVRGRELLDTLSTRAVMNDEDVAKLVHINAERLLKV